MLDLLRIHVLSLAFVGVPACQPAPQPAAPASASPSTAAPAETNAGEPAPVQPPGPAAGRCDTDADCAGGVCEGEGCGPGEGTCAPRERMCTRDLQPYCGCDGQTFRNSGSCPGARFSHRGDC